MDSQEMEMKRLLILLATVLPPLAADAQTAVSYSLPRTVLELRVQARKECFHAGPYARFAAKYFGIEAEQQDRTTYSITGISLTPKVEADQSVRYSYEPSANALPVFMQLTSQGLVAGEGAFASEGGGWKYPAGASAQGLPVNAIPANLAEETHTLYRRSHSTVQQSVVVEKSPEAKASEIAQKIFDIRENKYKILVGDTDATYSGEAMKAAIDELNRMEQDCLTLFLGYSEFGSADATFEIVPEADNAGQLYIAFRISDEEGLVPASNVSGKPCLLELRKEEIASPEAPEKPEKAGKAPRMEQVLHYRIPAVCDARISDGVNTLLKVRVPVYQLGTDEEYPIIRTK